MLPGHYLMLAAMPPRHADIFRVVVTLLTNMPRRLRHTPRARHTPAPRHDMRYTHSFRVADAAPLAYMLMPSLCVRRLILRHAAMLMIFFMQFVACPLFYPLLPLPSAAAASALYAADYYPMMPLRARLLFVTATPCVLFACCFNAVDAALCGAMPVSLLIWWLFFALQHVMSAGHLLRCFIADACRRCHAAYFSPLFCHYFAVT